MKFKFSYEKLEEFYRQQEEMAKRDYVESLNHLENEKQIYKKMYADLDMAEQKAEDLKRNPSQNTIASLNQIDFFIDGQKKRIEMQRQVVINHTQISEQKQEILIVAAKDYKTYQRLREKQHAEFKKKEKKKELKINDELVVTRFRRGDNA